MKILERYNTAVHASNLKPDNNSISSDLDVLGAVGLAAKAEPMGIALARMLSGGGDCGVVHIMADATFRRARTLGIKVNQLQAQNISKAVLAWFRDGRCNPCGGTGFKLIPNTPSLGGTCLACQETGKMPFEKQFRHEWRELALWLKNEVDRSQASAGVLAMKKLAPSLNI